MWQVIREIQTTFLPVRLKQLPHFFYDFMGLTRYQPPVIGIRLFFQFVSRTSLDRSNKNRIFRIS
jgi:hypothetical protein